MTQKRKNHAISSDNLLESKRLRPSNFHGSDDELDTSAKSKPRVDPTYGQRSAFPGLDELADENTLFYGPASDGLEYLQMVRSEAKEVPNLLVAPLSPRVVATNGHSNDEQGYYADGAYTALPDARIRSSDEEDEEDPQEAYYASLCNRFSRLSATLQCPPPTPTTSTISAAEQASSFNPSTPAQWRRCILNTQPRMLLLSQLGQTDVVSGLAVLEKLLTSVNLEKRKNIGAWAWGLLARCREVGQMGSEEVAVLRDLGKKARGIIRGIMAGIEEEGELEEEEAEVNAGERQEGEDDDGKAGCRDSASNGVVTSSVEEPPRGESLRSTEHAQFLDHNRANNSTESTELPTLSSDSSDPLAAARQRLLDSIEPSSPGAYESETIVAHSASHYGLEHQREDNILNNAEHEVDHQGGGDDDRALTIHATLDMIITVIGEFYGQRDLLDGRLLWDEM